MIKFLKLPRILPMIICCFILNIATSFCAQKYSKIKINGNMRIEKTLIVAASGLKINQDYDVRDFDRAINNIYKTGYFSFVDFKESENILIISVKENPIINKITISDSSLDQEMVLSNLRTKEGHVYSYETLKADIIQLNNALKMRGNLFVSSNVRTKKLKNNKIDINIKITEGQSAKIHSIGIVGNNHFSSSDLRMLINSKTDIWYNLFLISQSNYSPASLEADKDMLVKFYNSKGFLDTFVEDCLTEYVPSVNGFYITFFLSEGNRYSVDKVDIVSSIKGIDIDLLKKDLLIKKGDDANIFKIQNQIELIKRKAYKQGFNSLSVEMKFDKNSDKRNVKIKYNIKKNMQLIVKNLHIQGNEKTQTSVILNRISVKPGDVLSDVALSNSQYALLRLGFFQSARLIPKPNGNKGEVDVFVKIKEKDSTATLKPSLSYKGDGLEFSCRYDEINFLGTGKRIAIDANKDKNRKSIQASFAVPYAFNRDINVSFNSAFNATSNEDTGFKSSDFSIGSALSYALSANVTQGWNLNVKRDNVESLVTNSEILKEEVGKYVNCSIGSTWSSSTIDHPFMPNNGYEWHLGLEINHVGSDDGMGSQLTLSGVKILPISKRTSFAISSSCLISTKFSSDKHIRIFNSFHLGGKTLRGFDQKGIGPREINTNTPLGGNISCRLSGQLNFPIGIPEEWKTRGFLFMDCGSLINSRKFSDLQVYKNNGLRLSVGFGVRMITPYGPFGITWAFPLVKENHDIKTSRHLELFGQLT